jgi:hypothetical protein
LERLGFPWILSCESSIFNDLPRIFDELFFDGFRRRGFRLRGGKILDKTVDLVEQALPLFWIETRGSQDLHAVSGDLAPEGYVSSISQSSPKTHRSAESLPFSIPHSKASQGPRFSRPNLFSTLAAAFSAPSQISRWIWRVR